MRHGRADVGVRELRQSLSVYLRRVKAGANLAVRERGRRPSRKASRALSRLLDERRP